MEEKKIFQRHDLSIHSDKKEFVSSKISISRNLISGYLPKWLSVIGWLYFALSLLGGIILITNAEQSVYVRSGSIFRSGETIETTNNTFIALGITGIISSLIVLLICLGISRVIKQNILIINKLSDN